MNAKYKYLKLTKRKKKKVAWLFHQAWSQKSLECDIHIPGEKSLKPYKISLMNSSLEAIQAILLENLPFSNGMTRMHFIPIKSHPLLK